MDFQKCPQAEGFNIMFNNMDVFYAFQMRLPVFMAQNSPSRKLAMQLLHQFVKFKPIENEKNISMFFSNDAQVNNIEN